MRGSSLALLGVMAISAFFMFWRVDRYPLAMLAQEGCVGLSALRVREGDRAAIARIWRKPLDPQRGGASGSHSCENNPFLIYPTALSLSLFGADRFHLALRLASMLCGWLSVILLHLLVSRMFNTSAGLIAAFLLAVSPWMLGLSRVAGDYSASILFTLICFWLYFYARNGRHLLFLGLGLAVSLATYFYGMARLVAPVIALSLLADMALVQGYFRSRWPDAILAAAGMFLGLILQGGGWSTYFRQNVAWDWSVFADRSTASAHLLSNLEATGRRLFVDWGWNEEDGIVVERSLALDTVTRWCFALGVIWAVARIARSPDRFLLLWLAFAMLPVLITGAEFRRAALAPPAVFACAGIGVERTVRALSARGGRFRPVVSAALLVPLLAIIAYLNYNHYFGRYEGLAPDHPFRVRAEAWRTLVGLIDRGKVYTDLGQRETGYEEGIRFEEWRLGRPGSVVLLEATAAEAAFARDTGHCILYLSDGRREEK